MHQEPWVMANAPDDQDSTGSLSPTYPTEFLEQSVHFDAAMAFEQAAGWEPRRIGRMPPAPPVEESPFRQRINGIKARIDRDMLALESYYDEERSMLSRSHREDILSLTRALEHEQVQLENLRSENKRLKEENAGMKSLLKEDDEFSGADVKQAIIDLKVKIGEVANGLLDLWDGAESKVVNVEDVPDDMKALLGPGFVEILCKPPSESDEQDENPFIPAYYLSQACIIHYLEGVFKSFCFGLPEEDNKVLSRIYDRLYESEPSVISSQWRIITHSYSRSIVESHKEKAIAQISSSILGYLEAANKLMGDDPEAPQSFLADIKEIAEATLDIVLMTKEKVATTVYDVFAPQGGEFDQLIMQDALDQQKRGKVLSTTDFGLAETVRKKRLDGTFEEKRHIILSANVLLEPLPPLPPVETVDAEPQPEPEKEKEANDEAAAVIAAGVASDEKDELAADAELVKTTLAVGDVPTDGASIPPPQPPTVPQGAQPDSDPAKPTNLDEESAAPLSLPVDEVRELGIKSSEGHKDEDSPDAALKADLETKTEILGVPKPATAEDEEVPETEAEEEEEEEDELEEVDPKDLPKTVSKATVVPKPTPETDPKVTGSKKASQVTPKVEPKPSLEVETKGKGVEAKKAAKADVSIAGAANPKPQPTTKAELKGKAVPADAKPPSKGTSKAKATGNGKPAPKGVLVEDEEEEEEEVETAPSSPVVGHAAGLPKPPTQIPNPPAPTQSQAQAHKPGSHEDNPPGSPDPLRLGHPSPGYPPPNRKETLAVAQGSKKEKGTKSKSKSPSPSPAPASAAGSTGSTASGAGNQPVRRSTRNHPK